MNHSSFVQGLLISILACVAAYKILATYIPQLVYADFNYYTIATFVVISIIVYLMAMKALKNNNKNSFMNIVVLNLFMKIIASFALVALYISMNAPEDKFYLIPLTLNYLIFTVFETIFLSKAAKVQ